MAEEFKPIPAPEIVDVRFVPGIHGLLQKYEKVRGITSYSGQLYLSGGRIRDVLLKRSSSLSDYDFWGDFDLNSIKDLPGIETVEHWPEIGVLKTRVDGEIFEFIATTDVKKTLGGNDITSSTIILTEDGQLEDFFGGLESIRRKEIRVNEALTKFKTDPSQILRTFKFAALLGFSIEENTLKAALKTKELIPLSKESDLEYEVKNILSSQERDVKRILNLMQRHGVYVSEFKDYREDINRCISVEDEIAQEPLVAEVEKLFPENELRLVGGAVREYIWGGKIDDFDFIVDESLDSAIGILVNSGYTESTSLVLNSNEYYVNKERHVVSIAINGMDVDIACQPKYEIDKAIAGGDISFSCGVYDVHRRVFENPEIVPIILSKDLYFCNPDRIKDDPILVLSALKQLSRVSDIKFSMLVRFFY